MFGAKHETFFLSTLIHKLPAKTHHVYTIPSPSETGCFTPVCKISFCNIFGLSSNSKKVNGAVKREEIGQVLPKSKKRGREVDYNSELKQKFES